MGGKNTMGTEKTKKISGDIGKQHHKAPAAL